MILTLACILQGMTLPCAVLNMNLLGIVDSKDKLEHHSSRVCNPTHLCLIPGDLVLVPGLSLLPDLKELLLRLFLLFLLCSHGDHVVGSLRYVTCDGRRHHALLENYLEI